MEPQHWCADYGTTEAVCKLLRWIWDRRRDRDGGILGTWHHTPSTLDLNLRFCRHWREVRSASWFSGWKPGGSIRGANCCDERWHISREQWRWCSIGSIHKTSRVSSLDKPTIKDHPATSTRENENWRNILWKQLPAISENSSDADNYSFVTWSEFALAWNEVIQDEEKELRPKSNMGLKNAHILQKYF